MKSSQIGAPRLWASVFIVKSVQGMAGFLRKGMGLMLARGEARLLEQARWAQAKLRERALRLMRSSAISVAGHAPQTQTSHISCRLGRANAE